jgi:hypothetical protein
MDMDELIAKSVRGSVPSAVIVTDSPSPNLTAYLLATGETDSFMIGPTAR